MEENNPYPELDRLGKIHNKSLVIYLEKKKAQVVQGIIRSVDTESLLKKQGELILLEELIKLFSKKDL